MTDNKPQFGEKAPEGWQNPLHNQQLNQEANAAGQPVGSDAETTPQQLNGVPHNLGGSAQPNQPQQPGPYGQSQQAAPGAQQYPTQPAQGQAGQPYQGQPGQPYPGQPGQPYPGQPGQPYPGQPGQPYPGQPGQPGQGYTGVTVQEVPEELTGAKKVDRIVTFVLLGLGFLATGFYALSLFGMPVALDQLAYVTGVSASGSNAIPTLIITAIIVVVLYVLTIVFSLLLLRKKKISFWVPLLGAVLSFIVFSIMITVAILQVIPYEMLSDPAFMLKLEEWLEYSNGGYYY